MHPPQPFRRLVHIQWSDSCSLRVGWKDTEEVERLTPSVIDSIGWLMSETKTHVTLAAHLTSEGHATGDMCIPKGCIVTRRVVKLGR